MIYIKRIFTLIIGIPLFIIFLAFAMMELLCLPIKLLINYIPCGNGTKYDTWRQVLYYNVWFNWIALPVIKILEKIDLLDKDIEF